MYAVGSDNNVGFKAVAVREVQPRGGGGLGNSDATMAKTNCFCRKFCREGIQQISPMHAIHAIPARRVGRDDQTNNGPVSPAEKASTEAALAIGDQRGDLVTGTVQRFEGGAVIVNLGKTDAILPRSEQIPGESYHPNERIRAIILDVRKVGQRVKIILSRTHSDFVRRLFELEIPEIADQIIAIRALAREAGYRSKVAVTSIDTKVDAVGACVGVRGTRIKNIVDELGGERIDIVRWNESLQVLIPNALQPAEIDEVMLCHLLGRAIVLVRDDQLSLAIGRRGQNVRLASKLVGWEIEIMTAEELDEVIEKAVKAFEKIEVVDTELAERLVEQGILSYDDLSVMEISDLVNTIEGLTEEQAVEVVAKAEVLAEAQTEELPRRKGARASASEPAPVIESLQEGESESETDMSADGSPTADEFIQTDSESGIDDAATLESSSALPSERVNEVAGEFLTDDSTDSERDEASDDEIHDLALAEEKSNYSPHGHEVSSPPSDEDQGESIRIVTEAVEQSGPESPAGAAPATNREPAVSPRHSAPPPSTSTANLRSDGAPGQADDES